MEAMDLAAVLSRVQHDVLRHNCFRGMLEVAHSVSGDRPSYNRMWTMFVYFLEEASIISACVLRAMDSS